MHRELSTTDEVFQPPKTTGLYTLTGVLCFLVAGDLWPDFAGWLNSLGLELPTGSREIFGVRYALLAAVIGGARTLYGSLDSLFSGKLGADLALAIACIAAILIGEPLVAAEVVLIGLVGECLESFTFSRTQNAIRKLTELFPYRCWLLRDGQEVRVLVKDVQVGDVVVVKPGARVPVDGIVRDGRSAVDASALTGESLPVDKGPGEEVLAGCLNQFGALTIEAMRVKEQTVAGRVLDLTARALKDKAPIERHADRLARWFLPIVLGLAALTFVLNFFWYAGPFRGEALRMSLGSAARLSVYPTLAVLVVACPCALILATPAAIIAALGRLAGTGVLLKSGAALERLAGVRAFAFDKTGTLTEGKLELGDVLPLDAPTNADELLRIAAVAEQGSEHPIARLVLQEAQRKNLPLESLAEFTAQPGAGVRARAGERQLAVGTKRLLEEQGIAVPAEAVALLDRLVTDGQTPLLVAVDGRVLGALGVRDRLRPEAYGVLSELRSLGIRSISLVTGDRQAVANKIAAELGIENVRAELLPAEKVEAVGPATAFVGDGINDTPALARATVGMAIGSGAEVAAEAGDIVLMGDPLRPLPLLVRLSRQTVRIIRQNILIFAFGVNIVGIWLTAWLWPMLAKAPGWYEKAPLIGVIYHQFGSLLVLLNSMRILAFERASVRAWRQRWRAAMQRVDTWIEKVSDVDELLHEASHRWKPIAAGILVLLFAGYALSGLTQIEPDEVGIVRRFGAPRAPLGPDLHWRWPWPIESVTKIQPKKVRSIEVGFRMTGAKQAKDGTSLTWTSQHEGEGVLRVGSEAVMPTGDGNLVEMLAVVHYRIGDPHRYLLEVAEPDEVLRANLETVLRESAAGEAFLELLTQRRSVFQADVFDRLKKRIEPLGLGVELEGLSLRDLHPPGEVVRSFHLVAQKAEERDKRIKDAEAEALATRRSAESEGIEIERRAEAAASRTVQTATTDRDAYFAWLKVRSELSPADDAQLWTATIARIRGGQTWTAALAEHSQHRQDRIAERAFLIDFRLTWMTLAETLGQRNKVFIDADKVPGRRTFFLFGPEQLTPPPVIVPNRPGMREFPPRSDHDDK